MRNSFGHRFSRSVTDSVIRGAKRFVRSERTRNDLLWTLSSRARISRMRFRSLRHRHAGQRCFILGNGPSLRHTDLTALEHEHTFGLNRIYLLFEELGFTTTYFVSVNGMVIEQCARDIVRLAMPKFIAWHARRALPLANDVVYVRDPARGYPWFSLHPEVGLWEGATVTYVAMQIAHYLGFAQVILIGVDHSFSTKGRPNQAIVSTGDDPNHFAPNYFGKGFRWQLPDLETSELAYRLARRQFEQSGREIVDATVGGRLEVFRKVEYAQVVRLTRSTAGHRPLPL